MKILMTGANGFLGARLARRLVDSGNEVRAIVRKPESHPELIHPAIELIKGDFTHPDVLKAAMVGIDQIFHLAAISTDWARDMRDFYKVNVEGTIHLIETARDAGVQKIVITSTAGMIGPPDPGAVTPVNEDHVRYVRFFTDYECSKMIMEERVQRFVKEGMNIVLVNPTRVFGPGPIARKNAYLMVIHSYLYKAWAPYPAFNTQLANMAFIDDVVEGHVLAMEKGRSGERYLLGGTNVTFPELFAELGRVSGKKGRPVAIPIALFKFWAWVNRYQSRWFKKAPMVTREWIHKSSYSWPISCEKAIKELGYQPTDLPTALRKTVDFLEAEIKAGRI